MGKNGGGLLSPQCPGYMTLYYDTTHLVRRGDGTRVKITGSDTVCWDVYNHVKQPYYLRLENSQQTAVGKLIPNVLDISQNRKVGPNTSLSTFGPDWVGRAQFNWRQSSYFAIGKSFGFGPYNLDPGEKVVIVMAEVCGYGPARAEETNAGVKDIGGGNGQNATAGQIAEDALDSKYAFYTVPNYWIPKKQNELNPNSVNTILHGSDYLTKYSLPDYINSNVVTVREAADRAIQAYTGDSLINYNLVQYWPEKYSAHGVYALPIPVPAPGIKVENTLLGENKIVWGPEVESFSTPRLQGAFDHYELYKSSHPLGPWTKLVSIAKSDPQYFSGGNYQFFDKNSRIGDYFYYSVLSVDDKGNKSGRTNMTLHQSSIGAALSLKKVFVTPNPFIVNSGQSGESVGGDINAQLRFYNLPRRCTVRIFSYSGQLIQTIEHDENKINHPYFQVTRNNQLIASGVYFYVVDSPDGSRTNGKFVIIN